MLACQRKGKKMVKKYDSLNDAKKDFAKRESPARIVLSGKYYFVESEAQAKKNLFYGEKIINKK